jgi:hypothetical protein
MQNNIRVRGIAAVLFLLVLAIPLCALAQPLYYTIGNISGGNLGTVTVWCSSSGTSVAVSTNGNFVTEVPGTVSGITINGYTAYYPTTTPVTLPNGNPGQVQFTSTSRVEVIDLLQEM